MAAEALEGTGLGREQGAAMMFFALVAIIILLAAIAARLGVPGLAYRRACVRWGLSLARSSRW